MSKKNIIILGSPGSGKGTQGDLLAKKVGVPRLSVGALIRRQSMHDSTEKAEILKKYSHTGASIPGDLLLSLLQDWMKNHHNGFVIDNFIRTNDQLEAFKKSQLLHTLPIDYVLILNASKKICKQRLADRRKNQNRPDEGETAVEKRFATYYESIDKIAKYFNTLGVLIEIDAEMLTDEVHASIVHKLHL